MLPGPIIIFTCPKCNAPMRRGSLQSGNACLAKYWTDGKREAPMLPEFPSVTKCKACKNFFWIEDTKTIGAIPYFHRNKPDYPDDWRNAPRIDELTIDEYNEAANLGIGNTIYREIHLRLRLWWLINDIGRGKKITRLTNKLKALKKENLEKLGALLDERKTEQKIMKAEIYRELGHFNTALKLLKTIPDDSKHIVQQLEILCKEKNIAVKQCHPYSSEYRENEIVLHL